MFMSNIMSSVLITGCSADGIGAALAIAYQKTGRYHVFATARTILKIPAKLSSDEENVTVLALDVTSSDSIEQAAKLVSQKTNGRLDILINNSGAALYGQPATETDIDFAKKMFDVNYFGVIAVTRAFLPLLVMAKGVVVNNSSIAGERWIMYNSNYCASKAALNTWSECLQHEVAALGVRVFILATGLVASTAILSNQPEIEVPEKSVFAPLASYLKSLPAAIAKAGGSDMNQYAQEVVQAIESGADGKVWLGKLSSVVKNLAWWLPDWAWARMDTSHQSEQYKLTLAADKWRSEISG